MKEAYAIYMSVKKLSFYIDTTKIIVRSDHLPLKKLLERNTLLNYWSTNPMLNGSIRMDILILDAM